MSAVIFTTPEELRAIIHQTIVEALAPMKAEAEPLFLRVAAYAARISVSERHAWDLVKKGLPTVGRSRGLRVDVARADTWMRESRAVVDDAVEADARRRARVAAKRPR